jgi:hypothetical protein
MSSSFVTYSIAQNQSFVQYKIGIKYKDYNFSPTQPFQYFQAFDFICTYLIYNHFTLHISYYLYLLNYLYDLIFIKLQNPF